MIFVVCDYINRSGKPGRFLAEITGYTQTEHGDEPGHVAGMERPGATGTWIFYVGY